MKKLALLLLVLVFGFWIVQVNRNLEPSVFAGNLNENVTVVRDGYDLPPLIESLELSDIALLKCNDMSERDYFAHKNPEGKEVWEAYDFGTYTKAGENLARAYTDAYSTVIGWKNSPKHLENLVDPAYKEVGYAVCKSKQNNYLIVQVFRG